MSIYSVAVEANDLEFSFLSERLHTHFCCSGGEEVQ